MDADLRKLKDKAAELNAKGKFKKAAEVYRSILESNPRDVDSRQKLAEALRKAGEDRQAVAEYHRVADRFAQEGLLIKAIAICKVILEIEPEHDATQQMLSDFYARKARVAPLQSPDRGRAPHLPPVAQQVLSDLYSRGQQSALAGLPEDGGQEVTVLFGTEEPASPQPAIDVGSLPPELDPSLHPQESEATAFEVIVETARQARESGIEPEISIQVDEPLSALPDEALHPVLPHIPLFSDLSPIAFQALTERLELKRVTPGEVIIRQGETGDRFYVIAAGQFRVEKARDPASRPEAVALLEEGAFFGEMALLSGAPRAASVIAESTGELLVISAETLDALCRQHPHVAESLARFYRHRLLSNAMASSPLFRPFAPDERKRIMLKFRTRRVEAWQRVIIEGRPSDGLYVVLLGAFAVQKHKGEGQVLVGMLREGDIFGEMSCLRKGPASATVVACRDGMLLRLPRDEFDSLVVTYPQILELVADLTDQRQRRLESIVEGHAGWDREVVLV